MDWQTVFVCSARDLCVVQIHGYYILHLKHCYLLYAVEKTKIEAMGKKKLWMAKFV